MLANSLLYVSLAVGLLGELAGKVMLSTLSSQKHRSKSIDVDGVFVAGPLLARPIAPPALLPSSAPHQSDLMSICPADLCEVAALTCAKEELSPQAAR